MWQNRPAVSPSIHFSQQSIKQEAAAVCTKQSKSLLPGQACLRQRLSLCSQQTSVLDANTCRGSYTQVGACEKKIARVVAPCPLTLTSTGRRLTADCASSGFPETCRNRSNLKRDAKSPSEFKPSAAIPSSVLTWKAGALGIAKQSCDLQ